MRHHAQNRDDRDAFLLALGQLWSADVEVDWSPLRGGQSAQLITLPGYPFERQRHWIEHRATTWAGDAAGANGTAAAPEGSVNRRNHGEISIRSAVMASMIRQKHRRNVSVPKQICPSTVECS